MITQNEVIKILEKTGAILSNSHFVGTSGRHFATYINKDALYPHTQETSHICKLFAQKFQNLPIEAVAAPALGGIILSTWTAYHLSILKNKEVLGVYTEKSSDKNQILTRGYDKLIKGKNVLVIEDLTQTGGSIKKVIESVRQVGGEIIASCVMVNKDPQKINSDTIGAPFSSLATLEVPSYEAKKCPLCKQNIPINTSIGHGQKFLSQKLA